MACLIAARSAAEVVKVVAAVTGGWAGAEGLCATAAVAGPLLADAGLPDLADAGLDAVLDAALGFDFAESCELAPPDLAFDDAEPGVGVLVLAADVALLSGLCAPLCSVAGKPVCASAGPSASRLIARPLMSAMRARTIKGLLPRA